MLDGWKRRSLADLLEFRNGMNFTQASQGARVKIIGVGDFKDKEVLNDFSETPSITLNGKLNPDDLLKNDDLLFVRSNGNKALIGRCVLVSGITEPISFSGFTIRGRVKSDEINHSFASKLVRSPLFKEHLHRMGGGSSINNLSQDTLSEFCFSLPPLPEQRKIAEILRTWDEAIEKLEALRAAKLRRITSVRQRLFEAAFASHNRLQRARDIFEPVSERARPDLPLLAVMQDIGIVRRDELDRRVAMPDGDTSSYKVVRPGDFVISLRSFEGGLEYSTITGLVSPAYTVLRPTTEVVGDYYRHFFKSRSFIGRLDKLIFGIRDGKQIAFRDFGDMPIPAPPVSEQKAQTGALGCLEADLALENVRIEALTRQKRGLMQKLLTGEWRVNVEAD
ncbi:restriction modification system DNA specificity domain protein [Ancylobacter novellus DSM 506]|uniref:Restriction modification system DNA specificity domain protein n=2 Tax=Ancylobacter novellus TaxID=921 RepID=D7A556_ANCN5|nr:restriction endonuclease subunit S [Ancylobacter novellus]ADH89944.1 restriction modification system DNA specificity domain protein [Ancylobacter novellus DSM 506]